MRAYHDRQRARLAEFGKIKAQREQDKMKAKRDEMHREIEDRNAK